MSFKRLIRTKRRKFLAASLALLILATGLQLFLLLRPTSAAWSPDHTLWEKRKQLTITNNSSDSLASGTTVAITVNTKSLYDSGKIQDDCDDLRIVYTSGSSHTDLPRHLAYASGGNCSTSETTKVNFQLQSALSAGSSSTAYYMYYKNPKVVSVDPTSVAQFNSGSTTFTAGAAKRSAPGPFTAAPIMQTKWDTTSTADQITVSRGSQVNGNFYQNLDSSGGSIVLWITPEWDGNDNKDHSIFNLASSGLILRKESAFAGDNNLAFYPTTSAAISVDVNSWIAGTTYNVVLRWDTRNTLSGSNYASVSIDDSHTFGITTAPGIGAPLSNLALGIDDNNNYSPDAIVEGLTIYRRPLYDGTNGIDAGNGDEIAAIYNSGSGADPTLTTGSWDVVFALPTDQSVGALSTGTGEAWSHPYSSNLMYDTTTDTGGFMLNGTYTTDSWANEGTPSTVAALAASEKIFAGGYKVTSDAVDEGIYYTETVTAGDDWVIRALGNSDGTCNPKVILYDQTGTAEIGSLTGTTTSTRTAPDVYLFTGEAPASSTELRVKLINTASTGTCYWHQVELLSNLVNDPSLESGTGDPYLPPGWTNQGADPGDLEQETTIVHSGSASLEANSTFVTESIRSNTLSGLSVGDFLGIGYFSYSDADRIYLDGRDSYIYMQHTASTDFTLTSTNSSWTHLPVVGRVSNASAPQVRIVGDTSPDAYADDVYAVTLDNVSLTVTPATVANSTESSGIRVDGRDTLTQTLSGITSEEGAIIFDYTPRHSAANAFKFIETTDVYIAEFYGGPNDYIRVYWSAANTVGLSFATSIGSGGGTDTGDVTGAIDANSTYTIRVDYATGDSVSLYIDGIKRASVNNPSGQFGNLPTSAYWGSRQAGDRQADATYAAPSNTSTGSTDVFDIGSKKALLVCPFDGSTTCVAGETPSTESGAIRYSGSKSALSFDGANDYALTSTSGGIGGLSAFTTEMWVRSDNWDSSSNEDRFAETNGAGGVGGSHMRYLDTNSRFQMDVNIGGTWKYFSSGNNTAPTDANWHHIAVTYDGSTLRWFVDGTQTSSTGASGSVGGTEQRVTIGAGDGGSSNNFNGGIDEFRISTVARYTSNFIPSTAPLTRDEHTKLLYHFDENGDDPRNSGNLTDDSGNDTDAAITGAKYVSELVGVDNSTSDTGNIPLQSYAGQEGIFVEYGVTNKITNPSFDHGTYNTNWDAEGANLTVTEETSAPFYKFGSKSAKLVASGTGDNDLTIGIDPDSTATHTLSGYVYDGTSGNVGGTVNSTIAELVFEGSSVISEYVDMGGGWWQLSYDAAVTDSTNEYGIQVKDTKTVYFDGVMLQKPSTSDSTESHTVTYIDGTLGSGYSWSGTAHESTSTRTGSDVRYTSSGNVQASVGSVSIWVKIPYETESGPWDFTGIFFDTNLANQDIDDGVSVYIRKNENLYCEHGTQVFNSAITLNRWYHVVAMWNGNNFSCYINASSLGSADSGEAVQVTTNIGIGIGQNWGSLISGTGTISDVRIYDSELTSAEITDLYQAGLVSRQEGIEVDRFSEEKGQNPVAIYHFDESYGSTANDSSQYGNNLTVSGATWETQSVGGRSQLERNLKFDGSNDYASRTWDRDFNFGTGSFSVSGWFRHPSTITGTDTILARYGDAGYKVYMNSSGFVCFGIDDDSTWTPADSVCTTTSYADSKWYQFEAVKNGTSSITIYINGSQITSNGSLTATGSLNSSASMYIGIDSDGSSNPWDGFLDEIVIYPYARDASQVKEDVLGSQTAQVYGASVDDFLTEGLVGYWPMDETSGTSVADSSGNGNVGTLTNAQETGTAEADDSTTTIIADDDNAGLATANDAYNDMYVIITGGGGCLVATNTERIITDYIYDATPTRTITVTPAFSAETDNCTFEIRHQLGGKFGNSLVFDKDDDYVDIGTNQGGRIDDSETGTIAAWIYPRSISVINDQRMIIGYGGAAASNNGRFKFSFGCRNGQYDKLCIEQSIDGEATDSKSYGSTTINLNQWSHVVLTSDGNRYRIYLNGTEETLNDTGDDGDWFIDTTVTESDFTLLGSGYQGGGTGNEFDGSIDETRIYNRALSPAEAFALYNWGPGPVGYWNMDEGTGTSTVLDRSGNANNGTMNGSMTEDDWVPGKYGGSLEFDGVNDYVLANDSASLSFSYNSDFTFMVWGKANNNQANDSKFIEKKSGPTSIQIDGNGGVGGTTVDLNIRDSNNVLALILGTKTIFDDGKWHHIVGVKEGNNVSLYFDGVLDVTGSASFTGKWDVGNIRIGHSIDGGTRLLEGNVDEAKIYNYARTPAQIIEDMNAGNPGPGSPVGTPIGYWQFDEGYGDTANDIGTGNNNGNLAGSGTTCPQSGDSACPTWTNSGKFGKALDFDTAGTTDDWVDTGNNLFNSDEQGTMTAWINLDSDPGTGNAMTIYNSASDTDGNSLMTMDAYGVSATDTRLRIGARTSNNYMYGNTELEPSTWYHVVGNSDGTTWKLYVNGIQQTLTASAGSNVGDWFADEVSGTQRYSMGVVRRSTGNINYFNGQIDELKIYNFALTEAQIRADMNYSSIASFGDVANQDNEGFGGNPPVGWWQMNENTGQTANDVSGNDNSGQLGSTSGSDSADPTWTAVSGAPPGAQGLQGAVLNFDGNDDTLIVNDDSTLQITTNITLSMWFKQNQTGQTNKYLMVKGVGGSTQTYGMLFEYVNDKIEFWSNDYSGTDPRTELASTITDTNWHHVVWTYDGSTLIGYLDGIQDVSVSKSFTLGTGTENLRIGSDGTGSGNFNGRIDDARVYDYALTRAQVSYLYNRGGPVGYWQLDECSGTTAFDASGNGLNGTLSIGTAGTNTSAGSCSSADTSQAWYNGETGKKNGSLDFDGTDDVITTAYDSKLNITEEITLMAWVYPQTSNNEDRIIARHRSISKPNYALQCENTTGGCRISFTVYNCSTVGGDDGSDLSLIPFNEWNHLAVTYSDADNTVKHYVNGNLVETNTNYTFSICGTDTTNGVNIGGEPGNSRWFDGSIDEAKLFNYVLTQDQIKKEMLGGSVYFGP